MFARYDVRHGLSALFLAAACTALSPSFASSQTVASAQADRKLLAEPRAVIELFTSQGCSSCPAADALLKTYAERTDVIALSLPVDYWDHLGWKDTLASPSFTARQKAYGKSLSSGNVYTPQVVINGIAQAVGSNQADIDKAIQQTRWDAPAAAAVGARRVAIASKAEGNKVTVEVAAAQAGQMGGTIWFALVDPRVDVDIKHGENRGRKLSYTNVVRDMTKVGMWSDKPVMLELPHGAALQAGKRGVVLLQSGESGRIVSAAWTTPR